MTWTPPVGGAPLTLAGEYTPPVGSAPLHIGGGGESSETLALIVSGQTKTVAALAFENLAPRFIAVSGQTQTVASLAFSVTTSQTEGADLHLTGEYTPPVGGAPLHIGGDESVETRALTVAGQTQTGAALVFTTLAPVHLTVSAVTVATAAIALESLAPVHLVIACLTHPVMSDIALSSNTLRSIIVTGQTQTKAVLKFNIMQNHIPYEFYVGGIPYLESHKKHSGFRRLLHDDDDVLIIALH